MRPAVQVGTDVWAERRSRPRSVLPPARLGPAPAPWPSPSSPEQAPWAPRRGTRVLRCGSVLFAKRRLNWATRCPVRSPLRLLTAVLLFGTFLKSTLPRFVRSKRIWSVPPFPNHVAVTRCTVLCFSDAAVPGSPPVPRLLAAPPFPGPPTLPRCRIPGGCDPRRQKGILFRVGVESRRTRDSGRFTEGRRSAPPAPRTVTGAVGSGARFRHCHVSGHSL